MNEPAFHIVEYAARQLCVYGLGGKQAAVFAVLDERANNIRLPSRRDFFMNIFIDEPPSVLCAHKSAYGLAPRRHALYARHGALYPV